jgi:3-deoxy-manno-octulosonate cytidylyltransferase (CMP-KDO synthetase)
MSRVLAVIPARYASTRLPGKVLAEVAGKPLVWHVYVRARKARSVDEVLVATDDRRVVDVLRRLGVPVMLTGAHHTTGTDRLAEVARHHEAEIVVNVQGDEPLIDPDTIDATVRPLLHDPQLGMATARHRITDTDRVTDPGVVKVVCDQGGRAIYFSRSPIPYVREKADTAGSTAIYWQHVGLYAYRRAFLLKFAELPPTPLEQAEKLEQLRALECGFPIAVVETRHESLGVDTPEDLERVRSMLTARSEAA